MLLTDRHASGFVCGVVVALLCNYGFRLWGVFLSEKDSELVHHPGEREIFQIRKTCSRGCRFWIFSGGGCGG